MFISQKEVYKRLNEGNVFAQTNGPNKGICKFGEQGKKAIKKELRQLHNREVLKPIDPNESIQQEKKRAMESLIFLTKKRDGSIKVRVCANGSIQKEYISREQAASFMVSMEALLATSVLDAYKNER